MKKDKFNGIFKNTLFLLSMMYLIVGAYFSLINDDIRMIACLSMGAFLYALYVDERVTMLKKQVTELITINKELVKTSKDILKTKGDKDAM